jgi:hypothetical protein
MVDRKKIESAFPFKCSHQNCETVYDVNKFSDVIKLWGFIYLTCGDKCIIGLTCPECQQTTVKKFGAIPSDFSVDEICKLTTGDDSGNETIFSKLKYVRFPSDSTPTLKAEMDKSQTKSYEIPSGFMEIQHNQEIENKPVFITEKNVETLLEIENNDNYKVFPRIVLYNSVYWLSDVWLGNVESGEELSREFLEQCHNSLEALYTAGFQCKKNISFVANNQAYNDLILNDLTEEEFQDMDRDLYAWDTDKFKIGLPELIADYQKLRNLKDFEIVCYVELINKYARLFYYEEGLKNYREQISQMEFEESGFLELLENDEIFSDDFYDTDAGETPYTQSQTNTLSADNVDKEKTETDGKSLMDLFREMSVLEKFWFKMILFGKTLSKKDGWNRDVLFQEIWEDYSDYARKLIENNLITPQQFGNITPQQFGKLFKKNCKTIRTERVSVHNKKKTFYNFPPLDECRKEFEKLYQKEGKIKWSRN